MKTWRILLAVSILCMLLSACKKDTNTNGTSQLAVRMTDAPGNYDEVNIDIQNVMVTTSSGNEISLNARAGVYNLLKFSNGLDTLLVKADINADAIEQVRLVLGVSNSVVINGTTYSMSTPSAQQSGLKVQVHKTLSAGLNTILIDFDAQQSVVALGNGNFQLKPVLRTVEVSTTGSIKGKVLLSGILSTITVSNGADSYSTVTDLNGNFMLKGLPAGTYDVSVTAAGYQTTTVAHINVVAGSSTDMGTVTMMSGKK